ncbi:Teichuronic acid biosynthesis protein TuaB [Pseudidiomarina piscicola]|uniref:Teichuronic acid biosynthesis protein TuaB n=2 Tax=Pseudidiomarina piscicola TaxID=2614830 RepID=A0A6S6WME7_9GAMM|nr:Teichuronic acid biosynthesis protein TuaB [Pseudidiomarina piscicola]VZT40718.1 Teichuronic acid biosynthesis protein TuaB [Pseudomonas aeruginosa]
MINLLASKGASTVFLLLLAKFLAPDAFGLIAMTTVVFELANVFVASGLGTAVIRSKSISVLDLNTVFYTNLGISIFAYTAIFISAPYVATFYSQPELTSLIKVMGLIVFINAAKIIQSAILSRDMDFKTLMKANTIATLLSGTLAVTAAYCDWGVWSLVVLMVSQALISASILWLASSWRPQLRFSGESFSRLFAFGRNLLGEGLLSVVFQNSYVLVIGRFFSAEITGLYFFARKINDLISHQLTGAVQQATFPALSTLQDDYQILKHKYRQIMQLMMFMIAPIMLLLAALSFRVVDLLFDEKWLGATPYLQLLCVVGLLYPIHALNVNLLNVIGRSDLVFKVGLFKKTVSLLLLFLALPHGVIGIVWSQVIASFLALLPNTYFSKKLVGYSLAEQLRDVVKPVFAAVLGSSVAGLLASVLALNPYLILLLTVCCGVFCYLISSFWLRAEGLLLIFDRLSRRVERE